MKTLISFVLLLSFIMTMLASCAGSGNGTNDNPGTSKNPESTADPGNTSTVQGTELDPLPEALTSLDYGNRKFYVLCRSGEGDMVGKNDFLSEELTNNPVEDAIYNRTQIVNETLNIDIQAVKMTQANIETEITRVISSGDSTYDLVESKEWRIVRFISQGYMYNLLDDDIDSFLDIENPWWSQEWIDQAILGKDALYFITGAPALTLYKLIYVMFYNKDFGERNKIEDLYKIVDDGKWTIDYVSELVSSLYNSLNGDDIRDNVDQYGLVTTADIDTDPFWSSCDMTVFSRNEEGWFEFSDADIEKIQTVFEKLFKLLHNNPGTWVSEASDIMTEKEIMFASGNSLLASLHLRFAEYEKLRNMQDEYGILPIPKYDEKQKEYYSYVHDQYSVFFIPSIATDPEMTSAVLEMMAYENFKNVLPVYYDLVLKGRYANDPQSRQMLDRITSNIKMDSAWIYGQVLLGPCERLIRDPLREKKQEFSSILAELKGKLKTYLKVFRSDMEKLEEG
ncbi:MAG: hypothetical protein J5933_04185 [Clostridia bacterium]|nr:hypothetical protein [Clostridia bacterium]